MNQLELMEQHVAALFCHDQSMRMSGTNDWRGGASPRFFLGRTNDGNLWRFSEDLPADVCDELNHLCKSEPPVSAGRPLHEAAYIQVLAQHNPVRGVWRGPAYLVPDQQDVSFAVGIARVRADDTHLLREGLADWLLDVPHQQPFVVMAVKDHGVAVCASVRITPFAHEAGVETLPAYRRRGYARWVVSAWARAVQEQGQLALYSTSDENAGSQAVAASLGMRHFGSDFHVD